MCPASFLVVKLVTVWGNMLDMTFLFTKDNYCRHYLSEYKNIQM